MGGEKDVRIAVDWNIAKTVRLIVVFAINVNSNLLLSMAAGCCCCCVYC